MKFILLLVLIASQKAVGKTIGYNWVVECFVTNEQMLSRLLLRPIRIMVIITPCHGVDVSSILT